MEDESDLQKTIDRSNRSFWMLGLTISTFCLLLPVIIWLFNRDWIKTLRITGWMGFGFIVLSFFLLGIRSTGVGMGGSENLISGEQGEINVASQRILLFKGMFKSTTNIGSWILLWGFLYVLPFILGVPLFTPY